MANGLLGAIKKDVAKAGSSRSKIFYVASGNKARIRFLEDMDDGRIVHMHDRWEPSLKVPCRKNHDEDADCPYCDTEGIRSRDMYCWSVWDYDSNEVKIFMYPANQCSPVPALVALFDTYNTLCDRDFSISRSGKGTDTSYAVIPLDKTKFRNDKAKPLADNAFWKIINGAHPDPSGSGGEADDDDEDEKPAPRKKKPEPKPEPKKAIKGKPTKPAKKDSDWEEDEDEEEEAKEESNPYVGKSPKELYALCKERDMDEVKPKRELEYYIAKLTKWDKENADEDEFWGEEEEEETEDDLPF